MKIIDAHNHPDWHGHDLGKFLENMDRYGISRTWLLSWECPQHDYSHAYERVLCGQLTQGDAFTGPIPFARCLSYIERAPERFILGYCPDPQHPDACQKLEAAHKIFGARLCGELKARCMYDNPDVIRLARTAGELGMPVTLHLQYDFQHTSRDPWNEWYGGTIETLERLLEACPGTNFLGHAPGFWVHISDDDCYKKYVYAPVDTPVKPEGKLVKMLRRYPNLYCDISAGSGCMALSRDKEYTKRFLSEFQDRVLYARDYFDNGHQELLNSLELDGSVLEKIYAGNAERLLQNP